MKINALRVSEVGKFTRPVAVEGFSGGLNVLAGPNEMGKSTLFRALRVLLTVKHSSRSEAVSSLVPYGGGQPLIEADLEIGGGTWRITKRFEKSARAQLIDLTTKTIAARGSEADEMLFDLLDQEAAGLGALGLLWVGQKDALLPPRPDFDPSRNKAVERGERGALMGAIEAEVGVLTGGGVADAVRARAEAMLGELVTMRGAKKGGRYAVALELRDRLQRDCEVARAAVASVSAAQEELEGLLERFAAVCEPSRIAKLEERAKAEAAAVAEVQQQRERFDQAREVVSHWRKDHASACEALEQFRSNIARLSELSVLGATDEARLAALKEAAERAQGDYEKARVKGERLRDDERRLQSWKSRFELSQKLEARTRALKEADELESEIARESERMRTDPATCERIDRLQRLEHQIALAEERLAAESPSVRVIYERGVEKEILADGAPLEDGALIRVREPIALEIAGVGRIEIAPGNGEGREDLLQRAGQLACERAVLLGEVGAQNLEEAHVLLAERRKRDVRLSSAAAELRARAPDGAAALRADIADLECQLERAAADHGFEAGVDVRDVERHLAEIGRKLEAARQAYPACAAAQREAAEALSVARSEAAARRQSIEELVRVLGSGEAQAQLRAELEARADTAQKKLGEALQNAGALERALPDIDTVDAMKERARQSSSVLEQARMEAIGLRERMSALSERILLAADNSVGLRLPEIECELERAEAEVRRLEGEIESLRLLLEVLQEARRNGRERLFAPLRERFEPSLEPIFGAARAVFSESFALEGLERVGSGVEEIGRLSDGTQEQLGIILRLTYARLLAVNGEGPPIILDDPLAYSDEVRGGHMFHALRGASEHHQVIVLTCRDGAFAKLGGTRLEVVPWQCQVDF